MKLHNISKVLGVGIAALLLTACKDGNDWSVDSSKARVFSVSSTDISIDREMTQATVTFKPTKGVENYTLEVSPSELNDNVVEGAAAGTKVINISSKEVNKEGKIEYTITGLKKDTRYWLRVRSNASGKTASKWTYYEDSSKHRYFKTKAEQIFSTYTYFATKTISPKYLRENEVELRWKNPDDASGATPAAVTHIQLTVDGQDPVIVKLSDTEIAAMACTLKYADYGIGSNTKFNVTIYNNDDKRGEFNLVSPKARPAGLHELADGETIEGLIAAGSGDLVIGIPGSTSSDPETDKIDIDGITIPEAVTSVTLYGIANGMPRLLNFTKQIAFDTGVVNDDDKEKEKVATFGKIRFENLQIQSSNKFGGLIYANATTKALTIDAIEFENVTIPQLQETSLVQLNNALGVTVKKLYLNYVDFKKQTDANTRFIYANNTNNVFEDIEINNSTFAEIKNSMFDNNGKGTFVKIVLNDVTIYNCIGKGKYFVSAKGTEPAPKIQAYRTIFAKSNGADCRGIQSTSEDPKVDFTFSSSYMTSDFKLEEKTKDDGSKTINFPFYVGTSVSSSTKIMKDPKNGDYTITDATIEAGDPRWIEPTDD